MIADLVKMMMFSIRSPKQGAEMVLAVNASREMLWSALVLVVALTVIAAQVMAFIVPTPAEAQQLMPFRTSPLMFAVVMWGLLALMVFCTHYIGRAFGGEGIFEGSLLIVIWLQAILLLVQIVQILLALVSPVLAGMFGLAFGLLSIWIFVNFVAVVHGFRNLGLVLAGMVASVIGVIFGLSLLFVLIATIFGVDLPNA